MCMRALCLLACVVLVSLTGCFEPETISQAEAEERVATAVSRLGNMADIQDVPEELSNMDVQMQGEEEGMRFKVDMEVEWGTQDAVYLDMNVASGGFSFRIELYCDPDTTIIVFGDEAYEARGDDCTHGFMGGDDVSAGPADGEMPCMNLSSGEASDVTVNSNGTITATVTVTEDGETYTCTVIVNDEGRVIHVSVTGPAATGSFSFTYGSRSPINFPETTERIPATVSGFGFLNTGRYEWEAFMGDGTPLQEFEIRVYDGDELVASFGVPGGGTEGGFTLIWEDDGQAGFTADDAFTITNPTWTDQDDYEVVIWDTWADRDVDDNPIPGPALLLTLAALAAVAGVLRRKDP